jgi:hypothetical protein
LHGAAYYTPPAQVRSLAKDLALLPAWYAEAGDYVFTEETTPPCFFQSLPVEVRPPVIPVTREEISDPRITLPKMEAAPWGLSPQSVHLFTDWKARFGRDIDVPVWKEEYLSLASRRTAADCLADIQNRLPEESFPLPPVFFSEIEEIRAYMRQYPAQYVLKTPYSSSGRGLIWLRENTINDSDAAWIKGALKKQGSISMEQVLDKQSDFALEFYSDGRGQVHYEGLSLFHANGKGAYKGNVLQSQNRLWEQLQTLINRDTLLRIQEASTRAVQSLYAHRYTGYLGVDMLIYRAKDGAFAIHPCVEINLRHTMGLVAIRLFEKYFDHDATALFRILYAASPQHACEQHHLMEKTNPLTFKNGKIEKGYLSLCPVTTNTHYIAYILAT